MTTPLFPSVIGHNLLDGGTDAQDNNAYPGPFLQDYAAAVVGAAYEAGMGGRTTPVRVATFGDSTAAVGTIVSPDNQDTTVYTAPFPGSGSTILGASLDKYCLPDFYPLANLIGNGGIAGETTTQMLARDTAVASITRRATADIINLAPDVILLRGGSINDVMALTAAGSTQTDIDSIYSRHVQIIDRLLSGGAYVIDEGIYGYSPPSGTQADIDYRRAALVSLNASFAEYATLTERVRLLSPLSLLSNPDGSYIDGLFETSAGVHLNTKGQAILAQAEADILTTLFGPAITRTRFPGVNLVSNPLLAATGSQAYGTVATGWTVGASGATRQNAKIETLYGMRFQTCEYVMSSAGQFGTLYAPFDPTALTILANDVFGFEFWLLLQNTNGVIPLPNNEVVNVTVKKNGAGAVVVNPLVANYTRATLDDSTRLFHIVVPLKIQEATAALVASGSEILFKWGSDVAGTYKLGMTAPRIVKLGTAVVTS